MPGADFTLPEARRIALAAQGFGPAPPAHLAAVIRRLGLIQFDPVNILVPAHYLVPFSRLGPYDRARFHNTVYHRSQFTEQWAHEASIVPVELWPLLRHRMDAHRLRPWGFEAFLDANPGYADSIFQHIRDHGPVTAADLPVPKGAARRIPGAWYNTVTRAALEALFGRGRLAVVRRLPTFARVYDLAERVIPAAHYQAPPVPRDDAQRELLCRAARACGLATAADLADYYRIPLKDARPRIAELAAGGELRRVSVDGWSEPAWLHREARLPPAIDRAAILSPFDPVVWYRPRTQRLWDFEYRLEIYTPQPQRRWGYYVLPFLMGARLVARVDLKADRSAGRLLLLAAHREAGVRAKDVAPALLGELRSLAGWLGLEPPPVVQWSGR